MMYPKVKVIQEEYDSQGVLFFKDFQPLSLYGHPSTSPEHKDDYYTRPYVRVPISSSCIDSKIKVNRKVAESNSKASSVLPPRAVLSSPENDAMHGTKTKNKTKIQEAGSKDHNSCQNRHVKCTKSYELDKRKRAWK